MGLVVHSENRLEHVLLFISHLAPLFRNVKLHVLLSATDRQDISPGEAARRMAADSTVVSDMLACSINNIDSRIEVKATQPI
jgi:hypothetical protein